MGLRIDVHHYIHQHPEQEPETIKLLRQILNINQNIMAELAKWESALNRIDTATTAIAQQLRDLKDQIAGGGLSAEVEEQVLTRLETSATQLEAVGQSVENPAPPIPPVEG